MQKFLLLAGLTLLAPIVLVACDTTPNTTTETDTTVLPNNGETGTLNLVANAEDIMRDGFVSKDGWELNFDHVYVTLNKVEAYQTNPPFDPDGDTSTTSQATATVNLVESPQTIDLLGGESLPTVASANAPTGTYNALYWELITAETGEAEDSTILLEGTAAKEGRTIDFVIALDQPVSNTCGEYVGDERKGILEANDTAELETTFHFDHIFGVSDSPADESPNAEAFGFDLFANLAVGDSLNINQQQLQSQLSNQDYETLVSATRELGHVGEGHCQISEL